MARTKRRRVPYKPRLTISQILQWADRHHRRHGEWPFWKAGPIHGTLNETWAGVASALYSGTRGLTAGMSLAELLRRRRGVHVRRPALKEATIFQWAKAHHRRTGRWPDRNSGAVLDAPSENWMALEQALRKGRRGLAPGSSIVRLLAGHGIQRRRALTSEKILAWADGFFDEHGYWPYGDSGPIRQSPGDTWRTIDTVLRCGVRGMPKGSSLHRFLKKHRAITLGRSKRRYRIRPERQIDRNRIMAWAREHRRRTGEWPHLHSGTIPKAAGLNWKAVDRALRVGSRGLPGGTSLAKLFGDRRKKAEN